MKLVALAVSSALVSSFPAVQSGSNGLTPVQRMGMELGEQACGLKATGLSSTQADPILNRQANRLAEDYGVEFTADNAETVVLLMNAYVQQICPGRKTFSF
jgi:hypothetical protein